MNVVTVMVVVGVVEVVGGGREPSGTLLPIGPKPAARACWAWISHVPEMRNSGDIRWTKYVKWELPEVT